MVQVKVNKQTCISCGVCWAMAGDVFELDPATGKSRIKEPYRRVDNENESIGDIPEELRSAAEGAANACPTGSISVG